MSAAPSLVPDEALGAADALVVQTRRRGVSTLRMNLPRRLNGWTMEMMAALKGALRSAATDEATRAVILTGTDPYYCAGVNLSSTLKPAHPKTLRGLIVEHNEGLFEAFLGFPKPIVAAVNGPAIGASVTSATLCDALLASDKATFSTPFAALGVPPEGCSSVHFPRLMGPSAQRMLGPEGWKPTGAEAAEVGLADRCVPHGDLLEEAQILAESLVEAGRTFRAGATLDELRAVNAQESRAVADAFLDTPFLKAQYEFLRRKKKRGPALTFFLLWRTRPLWSRLL